MKKELVTTDLSDMKDLAVELSRINACIAIHKSRIKAYEKKKEKIEKIFKDLLEDKDVGVMPGYSVEYIRNTRKSFDQSKFKEENAALYQQYTEEKPYRRFVLKQTEPVEEDEDDEFIF